MRYSSADIRHESTWQQFLSALERNPHMHLKRYLRLHHVGQRGFERWLYGKGYAPQTLNMIERLSEESIQQKQGLRENDSTSVRDKD